MIELLYNYDQFLEDLNQNNSDLGLNFSIEFLEKVQLDSSILGKIKEDHELITNIIHEYQRRKEQYKGQKQFTLWGLIIYTFQNYYKSFKTMMFLRRDNIDSKIIPLIIKYKNQYEDFGIELGFEEIFFNNKNDSDAKGDKLHVTNLGLLIYLVARSQSIFPFENKQSKYSFFRICKEIVTEWNISKINLRINYNNSSYDIDIEVIQDIINKFKKPDHTDTMFREIKPSFRRYMRSKFNLNGLNNAQWEKRIARISSIVYSLEEKQVIRDELNKLRRNKLEYFPKF